MADEDHAVDAEQRRAAVGRVVVPLDQAVQGRVPLLLEVYFGDEGRVMRVLQVHPDSASMERHMELAGPVFAKFADLVVLRTIDVYGSPSENVLEQLRRKAELLGTATVTMHDRQTGFARFRSRLVG